MKHPDPDQLLPDAEAEPMLAHQLLLCMVALEALAENRQVYPREVIVHRARDARRTLSLTRSGRDLLEAAT